MKNTKYLRCGNCGAIFLNEEWYKHKCLPDYKEDQNEGLGGGTD